MGFFFMMNLSILGPKYMDLIIMSRKGFFLWYKEFPLHHQNICAFYFPHFIFWFVG
jgi:hypothetical protein